MTFKITDSSSKAYIGKLMYVNGNEIKIGKTLFTEASREDSELQNAIDSRDSLRIWKNDNPLSSGTYIFNYELN
jgi:hypothetical protein